MLDKIADALGLVIREEWAFKNIFYYLGQAFSSFSIKGFFAGIMAVVEMFGMLVFGLPTTPRGQELDLTDYSLVFYDEFDGDALDTSVWQTRGNGPRRGGFNADSQVFVRDGNLIIAGEYLIDGTYGEGWYSGAVKLKERYTRGYFEIRCICNPGDEYWSAFWIQADAPYTASVSKGGIGGAEIDIFESFGYGKKIGGNAVTHTIHCAGVDGVEEGFQSANLGDFYGNNIYEEYNTYGLEWTEDEYIFFINGVETTRSSFGNGTSQVPEDVIVSMEFPDDISLSKDFYTEFVVDYVKIYQK